MKIKAGKKFKIYTNNTRMGRLINILLTFLLIVGVSYGFLSLMYWSADLTEWGKFGRFLLGAEGVIFLIKIIDEV